MHRATLIIGILASGAAAIACGGGGTEARSSTTITSGPGVGEPELSRSANAMSERLAFQLCLHEAECGRSQNQQCVDDTTAKARSELMSWDCDPASIRARAEECLASVRAESCSVDLKARARVCPVNDACTNRNARLESPGPALAEVMAR
jgi:hypothetical protein